jgi:hypothetical protein
MRVPGFGPGLVAWEATVIPGYTTLAFSIALCKCMLILFSPAIIIASGEIAVVLP